jgi:hypothetical protein
MQSISRGLAAIVAATFVLAPVAIASAVDRAPRVKPRQGLRKHLKRRPDSKADKNLVRGKIGVVKTFKKSTPLWVVREVFKCALDYDEGSGFNCYVKHNAEINVGTSRALKHLRRYQWKHFRKWASTYVMKSKSFALLLTRYSPDRYSGTTRELRIYLRSRQRDNPAPIMLRREGGIWKVYANSL